jgi:hypothetical protein
MAGKSLAPLVLIAIGLVVSFGCGDDDKVVDPDNNPPVILSVTADPDTIYADESTWVTVVAEMQALSGTNRSIELQPGCDCLEEVTEVQILAIVTDSHDAETRDSVKVVVLPLTER